MRHKQIDLYASFLFYKENYRKNLCYVNIKHGINGIGKSTISKGIEYYIVFIIKKPQNHLNLLKLELENIKNIDFAKLKELPSIIDRLKKLEINIDLYMHFKSDKTIDEINKINYRLKILEEKANHLQGKVNMQKKKFLSTINFFLTSTGYKY